MKRILAFVMLLALNAPFALAQTGGAQTGGAQTGGAQTGRTRAPAPAAEAPALEPMPLEAAIATLDLREQMRKFVQGIAVYARSLNANFIVIPENGLDLLVKRDVVNPERTLPAQAYMRSIDGVLVEELFFGFGKPRDKDQQKTLLDLAKQAKGAGLKVLVVDYASDVKKIDESYRRNAELNHISFAAHQPMNLLNNVPPYPARPFAENPSSILSLPQARNFLALGDVSAMGRQDEFALKMHELNHDILITEIFQGREVLSKRTVETLKFKKVGGKRLVLAQVDIGSAASYRYYWKEHWREGSPQWISAPHRNDPDKYNVQYWRQEWQKIISGDPQSYIYGVIAQGFDGVVLNGVEAYRFFEGATQDADEQNNK